LASRETALALIQADAQLEPGTLRYEVMDGFCVVPATHVRRNVRPNSSHRRCLGDPK
jgi:hypothetical protein